MQPRQRVGDTQQVARDLQSSVLGRDVGRYSESRCDPGRDTGWCFRGTRTDAGTLTDGTPLTDSTLTDCDSFANSLGAEKLPQRCFEVVGAVVAGAEFHQRVTLVGVETVPFGLPECNTECARIIEQLGGRAIGRVGRRAHRVGQRLGRAGAAICHRLLDEDAHRVAFVDRPGRQMADREALAASQRLPLIEADLDADLVELAPHRHRNAAKRPMDFVLEFELPHHGGNLVRAKLTSRLSSRPDYGSSQADFSIRPRAAPLDPKASMDDAHRDNGAPRTSAKMSATAEPGER